MWQFCLAKLVCQTFLQFVCFSLQRHVALVCSSTFRQPTLENIKMPRGKAGDAAPGQSVVVVMMSVCLLLMANCMLKIDEKI